MDVNKIFTYKGHGKYELRIIISLKNTDEVIYFNSLFFHKISRLDIKNNIKFNFKELSLDRKGENVSIKNIYEIEGVAFYIILSNDSIVYIFQDVINLDSLNYNMSYKLVDSINDFELYQELLEEIQEFGEKITVLETLPEEW